jgi:hypothetical protein
MKLGTKQLLYCFGVILLLSLGNIGYHALFKDAIDWLATVTTIFDQVAIILVLFFLNKMGA